MKNENYEIWGSEESLDYLDSVFREEVERQIKEYNIKFENPKNANKSK